RNQLAFVFNYADLRGDRAPEILSQMGGAMAFFSSIPYVHPSRTPWTIELLNAALRLARHVEMRLKHALACRRPMEYSPQIQPITLTPSHGSFPSGHATEAFISAVTLWMLLRDSTTPIVRTSTENSATAITTTTTSITANPPVTTRPYGETAWGLQLLRLAAR